MAISAPRTGSIKRASSRSAGRPAIFGKTVRKVLRSEPCGYPPRTEQPYPVWGPYLQVIDQWLTEDRTRPKKQRHTAKRNYDRWVREARFPLLKTLEMFDYHAAPGLDRRLLPQLASGEYISQQCNVIFLGKSGTGKTHLATGLGVEACCQGISTRVVTGCGLANELLEERQGLALSRLIKRYHGMDYSSSTSEATFLFPKKAPYCFSRCWRSGTNGGR